MIDVAKRLYLTYAKPHRAGYWLSILFFFLASAMEPIVPAMLGMVLNEGFAKDPKVPIWIVPIALVVVFMFRGGFTFCAQYLMVWANSKTILDLRKDLVRSLLKADAQLFHEVSPGIAVTKVINDPQGALGTIGGALTTILRDGTHTIVMLGYLLFLNWKLTLLALITLPLLAYSIKHVHRRGQKMGGILYNTQLRLVSVVDDIARAWRVVRTFDASDFELKRFSVEAELLQKISVKASAATSLMTPVSQTITSFGVASILLLALFQARSDATTVGEFVAFITALLLMVSRIRSLTDVSQSFTTGLIVAQGCFTLLDAPSEPDAGHIQLSTSEGLLSLEQVSVIYGGSDRAALNGLDMVIQPGQTVALVGASGAGKSTVVNLLLGFVKPSSGHVSLDGHALVDIKNASLRQQFAVVSQDIVLFDGSIAQNVVYAKPFDLVRVEQCLRAAHLWEFVSQLPSGVETQIGTNGSRLSGGQRQRLAIARAIYKEAPIWIFDEATSALDTESERAVQSAIDQWHGKRTLILIAHRLSTIRNADVIYVLGDGRTLEKGTHAELMSTGGQYSAMVRAQV